MLNLNEGINQAYTNLLKEELRDKEIYSILKNYNGTDVSVIKDGQGLPYFMVKFPNGKVLGVSTQFKEMALMKKADNEYGYEIDYDDGMFNDVVRFETDEHIIEALDYMSKDNDEQIQEDDKKSNEFYDKAMTWFQENDSKVWDYIYKIKGEGDFYPDNDVIDSEMYKKPEKYIIDINLQGPYSEFLTFTNELIKENFGEVNSTEFHPESNNEEYEWNSQLLLDAFSTYIKDEVHNIEHIVIDSKFTGYAEDQLGPFLVTDPIEIEDGLLKLSGYVEVHDIDGDYIIDLSYNSLSPKEFISWFEKHVEYEIDRAGEP